jgi:hypothetical protein
VDDIEAEKKHSRALSVLDDESGYPEFVYNPT